MATLDNTPVGCRDVPSNWPLAVGLRFKVGDNEFHRVGFGQDERLFRGLVWRIVEGQLVKGQIEASETDRKNLESRGVRLEAFKDKAGFYCSVEPVSYESHYIMEPGYHGKK